MEKNAGRVAALYDIHGNLPALEAVLEEVRRGGVERIVVGGDVAPGPMTPEVLARLLDLDLPVQFIRGNGERELVTAMGGPVSAAVPERFRELIRWSAEQLRPERERLASWPLTATVHVRGLGEVLFCHATPRDDNEIFTRLTPEDALLPIFENVTASVVVCGHTHMQFDRKVGRVRVVNAGSVGMPFQEPGAYWLLLGPDVQLQKTSYDLNKAAERIRQTQYPHAEDFAARNVLQPPTERDTLEAFARVQVKAQPPASTA